MADTLRLGRLLDTDQLYLESNNNCSSVGGRKMDDVDIWIRVDNLRARADYLANVPWYSRQDIELSYLIDGSALERWEEEKRMFSVPFDEEKLYPQFQLSGGQPIPIIKMLLKSLPEDMSSWQIAFWFNAGNSLLNGKAPQDCLVEEKSVIRAAAAEALDFIG